MKPQFLFELVLLAAIWGVSFIFMRVAVPEFGPIPLIGIRVALAAMVLLPVFLMRKPLSALFQKKGHILVVGIFNSALPFALFAYATLYLSAGVTSVLNATVSIFGAIVAYFWLREGLTPIRIFGLLLGFSGVAALVLSAGSFGDSSSELAVFAALGASFSYAVSASYIKQNLSGIDSLTLSTASLVAASLVMLPFVIWLWPEQMPSAASWGNAFLLAALCTGAAYILYFRLIANVGSSNATTVTLLIPLFGIAWGVVLLDELVTLKMFLASLMIITGTGLTTGVLNPKRLFFGKKT